MHVRVIALLVVVTLTPGTLVAQTLEPQTSRRVRVTTAGKLISGRLVAMDPDAVVILADGPGELPIHIPLSSISAFAVSKGRRPLAVSVLAGIGAGAASGFFGHSLALTMCGDTIFFGRCSDRAVKRAQLVGIASGVGAGVAVTLGLRRERWRAVSSLRSETAGDK